jgi:hypothetical protein
VLRTRSATGGSPAWADSDFGYRGFTRGTRPASIANQRLDRDDVQGTRVTIVGYGTTAPPPGGPADMSNYDGIAAGERRRWARSSTRTG